jgi:hypothetical protein
MGFLDSLKKAIQGPVKVGGSAGDDPDEISAALREGSTPAHQTDSELAEVKEVQRGPVGPEAVTAFGGGGAGEQHEVREEVDAEFEEGPDGPDT